MHAFHTLLLLLASIPSQASIPLQSFIPLRALILRFGDSGWKGTHIEHTLILIFYLRKVAGRAHIQNMPSSFLSRQPEQLDGRAHVQNRRGLL